MDPEDLRAQVPLLQRVTYLDSAATSLKPRAVLDAVRRFYEDVGANVERGAHGPGIEATEAYEAARRRVAEFLGISPDGFVFTRNGTAALNLLARGLTARGGPLADLGPGDVLVTSVFEHHSNLLPWQRLARERGATLHMLHPAGHALGPGDVQALPEGRVRLVAVQHASNVTGAVHDIAGLAARVRRDHPEALLAVDGAQAVGHSLVRLDELGVDAYACSGHKGLLGPMGTGLLWAKPALLDALAPTDLGGGTVAEVQEQGYTLRAEAARRLEGGTPDVAGALGLASGVGLLQRIGVCRVADHEAALAARLREGLDLLGARVEGPQPGQGRSVGVVSFNLGGWDCHDVALALDKERIAVRSGHHCAQPLARWLDVQEHHGGTVRASFHYYNTEADVDRLLAALRPLVSRA